MVSSPSSVMATDDYLLASCQYNVEKNLRCPKHHAYAGAHQVICSIPYIKDHFLIQKSWNYIMIHKLNDLLLPLVLKNKEQGRRKQICK